MHCGLDGIVNIASHKVPKFVEELHQSSYRLNITQSEIVTKVKFDINK